MEAGNEDSVKLKVIFLFDTMLPNTFGVVTSLVLIVKYWTNREEFPFLDLGI